MTTSGYALEGSGLSKKDMLEGVVRQRALELANEYDSSGVPDVLYRAKAYEDYLLGNNK